MAGPRPLRSGPGRPGPGSWAGTTPAGPRSRHSSSSALTWPWAEPAAAIAARGQSLARRLSLLGLPEDARVASLVAARALICAGRPARAYRAAARYGPPGRVNRLDTRLLWRLTRSELAAAAGQPAQASRQLLAGMAALHRHRTQFGCLTCRPARPCTGRDLARAGLAAALARRAPDAVYRRSERPGPRPCCCRPRGPRATRRPRPPWRSCGRPGTRCARRNWPDGRSVACAPGWRRSSGASASRRGHGTRATGCPGSRARPAPRGPGQPGRGRARHVSA